MKLKELDRKHIGFALTAVLLNEDNEEPDMGLEEIDQISDIMEKICDTLSQEEIKALAMVRPDTFASAIKQVEEIDKIFDNLKK